MTKLRLNAVIIEEDKNDAEKKYFNSIGSAFGHEDKKGFDLVLKALPTTGSFSLFTNKEDDTKLDLKDHKYLNVYVVESKKKEDGTYDNFYHKIGSAFPHKDDNGLNVELFSLPIEKQGLKTVIRVPKSNN